MSADLRVDWCDYKAAKYAVEHWHYSRTMPSGKLVKVGVWEDSRFIGAVLFGMGATPNICKPFGLQSTEVCELVRVALTEHSTPVSKILRLAMEKLNGQSAGLRLIVSFADTAQKHHGGIYQATNWFYLGNEDYSYCVVNGDVCHPRSLVAKYGTWSIPWLRAHVDPQAHTVKTGAKHKYVMPLDRAMRKQIAPLAKPYPKRATCGQGVEGDASGVQPEGAGSIPADRSDLGAT